MMTAMLGQKLRNLAHAELTAFAKCADAAKSPKKTLPN